MAQINTFRKPQSKAAMPSAELVDQLTDALVALNVGDGLVITLGDDDEPMSAYRAAVLSIADAQGLLPVGMRSNREQPNTLRVWRKDLIRSEARKRLANPL